MSEDKSDRNGIGKNVPIRTKPKARDDNESGFVPPPNEFLEPVLAVEQPRWRYEVGDFIDNRFKIMSAMGQPGGEAELYRCVDAEVPIGAQTYDGVVKLYADRLGTKLTINNKLVNLSHTDIVSLRKMGFWQGRSYEVMEYCAGGSLADIMPCAEADIEGYIPQIIGALEYLHRLGIIHRDIKPTNILFRDEQRKDLVLADFGISSLLSPDEQSGPTDANRVRKSETIDRCTLDYMSPEQILNRHIGPKSDYYSLGMTLIHILDGKSPCADFKHEDQIKSAHTRGRIALPTGVSERFTKLLQGLKEVDPEYRWGLSQVSKWLRGEQVMCDDGNLWTFRAYRGVVPDQPYWYHPFSKTPKELAMALDQFNAMEDLQRGYLSGWARSTSEEMFNRIEEIRNRYVADPKRALARLKYVLDPDAPLVLHLAK